MTDASNVNPIPEGYHTLTPYLHVKGAKEALDFYRKALGAEETYRMEAPDGSIMHAEMRVGNSRFMLSEEREDWGNLSPRTLGGTPFSLLVYVEDCDAVVQRALAAGATELMSVRDHFYGDRSGIVEDPFGHCWNVSTRVEDVPPEELDRRVREMMGG